MNISSRLCPNDYISTQRELFTNADGLKIQALDNHAYPLTHEQDSRREYAVSYATLTETESCHLVAVSGGLRGKLEAERLQS